MAFRRAALQVIDRAIEVLEKLRARLDPNPIEWRFL